MIVRDTPKQSRRLSNDVGILVSRSVLWPRERRLELPFVQERVFGLIQRDLDRFGVRVKRVVEVEVLGGQGLLSVVLREAPQHSPVTSRGVADDFATSLSRGDGHRLQNYSPSAVHSGLHEISFAEIRPREHVRWERDHAAVANLPHMNDHARTSSWLRTVYTVATEVNGRPQGDWS